MGNACSVHTIIGSWKVCVVLAMLLTSRTVELVQVPTVVCHQPGMWLAETAGSV